MRPVLKPAKAAARELHEQDHEWSQADVGMDGPGRDGHAVAGAEQDGRIRGSACRVSPIRDSTSRIAEGIGRSTGGRTTSFAGVIAVGVVEENVMRRLGGRICPRRGRPASAWRRAGLGAQ